MNDKIHIGVELEQALDEEKLKTHDYAEKALGIVFNESTNNNEIESFNSEQANYLFSILGDDLSNDSTLTMHR